MYILVGMRKADLQTGSYNCYLSFDSRDNITLLKNEMLQYGFMPYDLYDLSVADSIQQTIKRKIRESDFAVFLLTRESNNVLYEIGIAEGIGKQHFLLIDKAFELPFFLQDRLHIKVDLQSTNSIHSALEKIRINVKERKPRTRQVDKNATGLTSSYSQNIKTRLAELRNHAEEIRASSNGRELEGLIKSVFQTLDLEFVENTQSLDSGVDFVVWNEELGRIIGNQILIEVKIGNITQSRIENAKDQVLKYIHQTQARIGIVLYMDRKGRRFTVTSAIMPLLMYFDVVDFIDGLINSSFETVLLNERNKIAHGIS